VFAVGSHASLNIMTAAISFCGILLLASALVAGHFCRRFTVRNRHRWQALSAGVAMAYVFVNVMPELEEHRPIVASSVMWTLLDAEKRIYLWALAGFVAFAGLSRLRLAHRANGARPVGAGIVYWGAMTGWGIYMMLIGYLMLHREDASMLSLWLFVLAMGLHILMMDNQLVERFEGIYEPRGRVLLLSCLILGWALGCVDALPESFTSRLFAFVVGGVVITSAHEELSFEEGGRFGWFVGGAAVYATLLMLI
jgi:hypothetical protein